MKNELNKIIKEMKGNLLGIGLEEKYKKEIEINSNIINCFLLETNKRTKFTKNFSLKTKRMKKINIKKIRKTFKKKKLNNIIANYQTIEDFLKTFIRDSVYMCNGTVYIYGNKNDIDKIENKYKRYTNAITIKEKDNHYIFIADVSDSKTNKIKDMGYWWKDTATNLIDFITIILVN